MPDIFKYYLLFFIKTSLKFVNKIEKKRPSQKSTMLEMDAVDKPVNPKIN